MVIRAYTSTAENEKDAIEILCIAFYAKTNINQINILYDIKQMEQLRNTNFHFFAASANLVDC